MKQEEKDLLLKDLCARLPYSVQIRIESYNTGVLKGIDGDIISTDKGINYPLKFVRPYLFPLSSMTKEQKREYHQSTSKDIDMLQDVIVERINGKDNNNKHAIAYNGIDWLNSHHFDYRGLIEAGLAIDATDLNIYKEETK